MLSPKRKLPAILLTCLVLVSTAATAADWKPEEVVQKSLAAIGTPEARDAIKSRVVEGTVQYKILVGGSGELDATAVMVSEADKMQLRLKVNALQYHGEKFIRNAEKTFVAGMYDDGSRSEFGEFLRGEDTPLREGLLGGVLSRDWILLDPKVPLNRLHSAGLKKVDGVQLYALSYRPKANTDLDVTLYFDPETFRHVMTLYKALVHAGIRGANPDTPMISDQPSLGQGAETASARQQQRWYRIEERFSDFKTVDGVTLPSHYDLRFQTEGLGGSKLVDWNITTTRVLNNMTLDPRNFETH